MINWVCSSRVPDFQRNSHQNDTYSLVDSKQSACHACARGDQADVQTYKINTRLPLMVEMLDEDMDCKTCALKKKNQNKWIAHGEGHCDE